MQDLSKFIVVKQALEQVVAGSDVNNGTQSVDFLCHYWQSESVYDEKRAALQIEMTRAVLAGDIEGTKLVQAKMDLLPKPKIMMEFRLLQPIARIQGTKTVSDGDRILRISMDNVKSIFVPEDAVNLGLLEYEETEEKATDSMGRETTIIKLRLKKGIIDVTSPKSDRNDKIIVPKRAMVTPISYGAMQVAGRVLYNERIARRKNLGFEEQE